MRWDQGSRDPSPAPDISAEHTQAHINQSGESVPYMKILNITQLRVNGLTRAYFCDGTSFVGIALWILGRYHNTQSLIFM